MGMCVCGHREEEHKKGVCWHDFDGMFYCPCEEYRPVEKRLTVTLILKDGMEKSDHAIDVSYSEKTLVVDWADGTVSEVHRRYIQSLLVTA
jgi:hypothetical protein